MKRFNKILIANRGEIAVRIIRTLQRLGISTIAIFSEKDRGSLHHRLADEAFLLSGDNLKDTYLNIDKIIEIARESGAEAIHPGYGFLSENALFSGKTAEAGLNFIGPTADVINLMGNKLQARAAARKARVPLIEGFEGKVEDILENSSLLDFPVIVKAAAGGGGKAMRIVRDKEEFREALEVTRRESKNYFGDDTLYVEKYFDKGRHVEIQVMADHHGNILIIGERECTVQRRYQKVIEETPSLFITGETRRKMFKVSRNIVKEIGYVNAGTMEFLVDENQNFYFLEMNTRIQVEHPVTEQTYGIDIVELQVQVAAGNKLHLTQNDLTPKGHSIQARLYAEDPAKNFLPSPGNIYDYNEPLLPSLRIDSGIDHPTRILPDFDPLISKVIVTEASREEAILSLQKALKQYKVSGLSTNREFLVSLLNDKDFVDNKISTTWLEKAREKIITDLNNNRDRIPPERVFSVWLLKVLMNQKRDSNEVWQHIGYWRHMIRKSFVYEGKQYDIIVLERKKDKLRFELNDEIFEVELRSMNENKIIFLLEGKWSCGSVVSGKDIEDIVFIDGYEFRLKPVDYLPDIPFLKENISADLSGPKIIRSPLHGRIVKLNAMLNQKVKKGELLFTLDAMKIENKVISPYKGCVKEIRINEGQQVSIDQEILVIDDCIDDN